MVFVISAPSFFGMEGVCPYFSEEWRRLSTDGCVKKFGGNTDYNHQYINTIIIPPVSIAAGCDISNSIIGPHVAIGANTSIKHSIVRESIIGSYTNLFEVVLDNSLIGSDASVKGLSRSLNIGDNTEIDFG